MDPTSVQYVQKYTVYGEEEEEGGGKDPKIYCVWREGRIQWGRGRKEGLRLLLAMSTREAADNIN